jgi:Immunity protein 35
MINSDQARAVAAGVVERVAASTGLEDLVITSVEEFPVGWVFAYCRQSWLETQDFRYVLAGNAPILVDRQTGKAHTTGTAHAAAHYVAEYQAGCHVCRGC